MSSLPSRKYAIFLNGPIGAGKTTLGKALTASLDGAFIDGDDHSEPDKPWYSSILRTSRSVVAEVLRQRENQDVVVIAYPLRCTTWLFYRRHIEEAGLVPLFITLRASFEAIVSPSRGRIFSEAEKTRIRVMLSEGYAERQFSDAIIDTDFLPFNETLFSLINALNGLMGSNRSTEPSLQLSRPFAG